jgi:hypothetical protein
MVTPTGIHPLTIGICLQYLVHPPLTPILLICSLLRTAHKEPFNVLHPYAGFVPLKDAHPLHEERVSARFLADKASFERRAPGSNAAVATETRQRGPRLDVGQKVLGSPSEGIGGVVSSTLSVRAFLGRVKAVSQTRFGLVDADIFLELLRLQSTGTALIYEFDRVRRGQRDNDRIPGRRVVSMA